MATSVVASSKLSLARFLGVNIPVGWATTAEGDPITDPPENRSEAWALNPLGNTKLQGGHKGYGLAVVIDILAGLLSGGGFGTQLSTGENMTWVMAVDIAKFLPPAQFKSMMDDMIRELHATPPEADREAVLVAGDPEADIYEERTRAGIPLHRRHLEALRAKAKELDAEILI